MQHSGTTPAWTSRFAFLMASIGFAVGLGNIWRFPYIIGENGGGAFVLVYLVCAFSIGLPILIAELMIGRRGRMTPAGSMKAVALEGGQSSRWQWVGIMNLATAFLIMVTYSVVAGWVFSYLETAITTGFSGVDATSANQAFDDLLASPLKLMFWMVLTLLATGSIIYAGVENGIERAVKVLMPILFILMFGLVVYNYMVGGFSEAISYLFNPDFSKINASVMLAAIGQAFFSIGVAMAGMMTFGAYLPKEISIARSALIIIVADTFVAFLAGLVIFPAVFNNGLDPAGGPGLIFQTLPVAFASMPGGHIVSVCFFLLLSVAAVTSMVGLIEPLTHFAEEKWGYTRHRSAVMILAAIGFLSIFSVLSYNLLANFKVMGNDLNTLMDFVSNQLFLPLGGMFIALFTGWFVSQAISRDEIDMSASMYKLWHFLIRYIVPPAILVVFVLGIT